MLSIMVLATGLVGCGAAVEGSGEGELTAVDSQVQTAVDNAVQEVINQSINDIVQGILDRVAEGVAENTDSETDDELAENPEEYFPDDTDFTEVDATPEVPDVIEEVIDEVVEEVAEVLSTIRLSWAPASTYEDGTAMPHTDIAHYVLVYGQSIDAMTTQIQVSASGLNSHDLEQMPAGNWHIALKTVSIFGSESNNSNALAVSL